MRFRVLALDYDGTIAEAGVIPPGLLEAIRHARDQGIAVLLVTGRRLDDLRQVAGDLRFADAVVAEGGAVVLYPESNRSFALAPPPSPLLLEDLRRLEIHCASGECIVEADASLAPVVLDVIRGRQLPLAILFNRSRLMVLPQSVSKATGLRNALATLRLSAHNALAIGDAENDHAMLEACEFGAAVGWGSATLKAAADAVVAGTGPKDLAPYVHEAAGQVRLPTARAPRRAVLLGSNADCRPVVLPIHGRNVLIAGDPGSGKSWLTGLLCEQLILAHYSACVIDPEGDYTPLESLPGVVVLGHDGAPSLREVERAVRFPDVSVIVDLSAMAQEERLEYVPLLIALLNSARRQRGFPHRIVVDEAHYFLHAPAAVEVLDLELAGYTLVTYKAAALDTRILQATDAVIVTRENDPGEAHALHAVLRGAGPEEGWRETLAGLEMNEAVLVSTREPDPRRLERFRTASRLTPHVRHRHKYTDVPVSAQEGFAFTRGGVPVGPTTRTLSDFSHRLRTSEPDVLEGHLRRHDFSRWIARVFRDRMLSAQVLKVEEKWRRSGASPTEIAAAIAALIVDRYVLSGPGAHECLPAVVSVPA